MYVYVILCGCIGDTSIQGIYSTKAKVNKALKAFNKTKENGVETWIEKWKVDDEEYFKIGKQYK